MPSRWSNPATRNFLRISRSCNHRETMVFYNSLQRSVSSLKLLDRTALSQVLNNGPPFFVRRVGGDVIGEEAILTEVKDNLGEASRG